MKTAEAAAPAESNDVAQAKVLVEAYQRVTTELGNIIVGQQEVIEQLLIAILARGHCLLEGVPGLAKTLMVRGLSQVMDLSFRRVQFTPDLMPADIMGTEVINEDPVTGRRTMNFLPGPLFAQMILADEINRTPPKTQSALLEAMQEHSVTIGGKTYPLPEPFFVLATQNPIEQEGIYPLPEAQMDRFMFNIWVDYPQEHEEETIVRMTTVMQTEQPQKVLSKEQMLKLQDVVRKVPVSDHVIKYAIRLVRATRPGNPDAPDFTKQFIHVGSGPRAGQYLVLAAKARAIMEGRIHVSCADIRKAAIPVLRHRILTNFAADSEGLTSMHLIDKLLKAIPEPSEKDYGAPAVR